MAIYALRSIVSIEGRVFGHAITKPVGLKCELSLPPHHVRYFHCAGTFAHISFTAFNTCIESFHGAFKLW